MTAVKVNMLWTVIEILVSKRLDLTNPIPTLTLPLKGREINGF
jgi:hypothetical protein